MNTRLEWEVFPNKFLPINTNINQLPILNIRLIENTIWDMGTNQTTLIRTNIDNPVTLVNEGYQAEYCINPEYYQQHKEEVNSKLIAIIQEYNQDTLMIDSPVLLTPSIAEAINHNNNIKYLTIGSSDNPYPLTSQILNMFPHLEQIDSYAVSEELQDNFNPQIGYNNRRRLIDIYRYQDLKTNETIILNSPLSSEETKYLTHINPNATIKIKFGDISRIQTIITACPNNTIIIKDSPDLQQNYNQLNFPNTYLETKEYEEVIPVSLQVQIQEMLKLITQNIKNSTLSPFEQYISCYNIVKQFKPYQEVAQGQEKNHSRELRYTLFNNYMVCRGYTNMLHTLLQECNIDSTQIGIIVNTPQNKPENHSRLLVHIKDQKYNLDGFYISDPTWDNVPGEDYYNYLAMTPNQTGNLNVQQYLGNSDIIDIHNEEEFQKKLQIPGNFTFLIDTIKKIDKNAWNHLLTSYPVLKQATIPPITSMENNGTLITMLYQYIMSKTQNPITLNHLEKAIPEVINHTYINLTPEELDKITNQIIEKNKIRENKIFPPITIQNTTTNQDILLNETNKFTR